MVFKATLIRHQFTSNIGEMLQPYSAFSLPSNVARFQTTTCLFSSTHLTIYYLGLETRMQGGQEWVVG